MLGKNEPFDCEDDHDLANKVAAELSRIMYSVNRIQEVMDVYFKKNMGEKDNEHKTESIG